MSAGRPSNVTVLTHENKIWSAKRKQKREQVKEVVFDEDARRHGFSIHCGYKSLKFLQGVLNRLQETETSSARSRKGKSDREGSTKSAGGTTRGKPKFIFPDEIDRISRFQKRKQLAERAVENARAVEQVYAGGVDLGMIYIRPPLIDI
jgi:ribosomal RNA-processing protein 17